MLMLENLPPNVFSSTKTLPKNKQLFYLANDKRKRFGWKYIWTNNERMHLRQTNDSKVITILHEKALEQIEKPTTESGNLYGSSAFADTPRKLTDEIPVPSFRYGEWSTYCPYTCLVCHNSLNNPLNQ